MKNIQFVIDTSLVNFFTGILLGIGTNPTFTISRKPENFLGEKVLVTFTPPSERTSDELTDFLKRFQETTPSLNLLD